jgi:hypothetical protein
VANSITSVKCVPLRACIRVRRPRGVRRPPHLAVPTVFGFPSFRVRLVHFTLRSRCTFLPEDSSRVTGSFRRNCSI